jgi:S-adenosylmethionine:tRNA ribosyltransferase-isomerase
MCAFSLADLDYELPERLIAQEPSPRRGDSRLLVVHRDAGRLEDRTFEALPSLLGTGDALVMNDTRVVPAKLCVYRQTGGRIEGIFLREIEVGCWEVMLRGRGRLREGERLTCAPGRPAVSLELTKRLEAGRWHCRVTPPAPAEALLAEAGITPLPPYIRRAAGGDARDPSDRERYQTVFARRPGAVAAPTAGMHFTPETLRSMEACGVQRVWITLHVGMGTFTPITAPAIEGHRMHAEWFELPASVADTLNRGRQAGGRIVAVGTTVVRVLETCADGGGRLHPQVGWTDIFCYPPYRFQAVDRLLTNFHLPRSTLLALVMAFAGIDLTRRAYEHAIARSYRFYSYGDAMLIV